MHWSVTGAVASVTTAQRRICRCHRRHHRRRLLRCWLPIRKTIESFSFPYGFHLVHSLFSRPHFRNVFESVTPISSTAGPVLLETLCFHRPFAQRLFFLLYINIPMEVNTSASSHLLCQTEKLLGYWFIKLLPCTLVEWICCFLWLGFFLSFFFLGAVKTRSCSFARLSLRNFSNWVPSKKDTIFIHKNWFENFSRKKSSKKIQIHLFFFRKLLQLFWFYFSFAFIYWKVVEILFT